MGSLPMPPQIGGPQIGGGGQFGPVGPGGGLSAAPNRIVPELITGINNFVKEYTNAEEGRKEHYKQKFYEGIQQIMLGLGESIDKKKLMQYAQRAGLPLKTEAPTPEEVSYQKKQELYEQSQKLAASGAPGMIGVADMAAAVPPPGAPPQPQQPSMMGRFLQSLGIGRPPVSMASPAGQFLSQLSKSAAQVGPLNPQVMMQMAQIEAGKRGLQLMGIPVQKASMEQTMSMLDVAKRALSGDMDATLMAVRSGVMKDLPLDDLLQASRMIMPNASNDEIKKMAGRIYLFGKTGGQQMQMHLLNFAKDLLPRFHGDLAMTTSYVNDILTKGSSSLQPNWTADEWEKIVSSATKLNSDYPTAPWSLTMPMAIAGVVPGGQQFMGPLADTLSKYPRNGTLANEQWQKRFGFDVSSFNQRLGLEREQLELSKMRAVVEAGGSEMKMYWDQLNRKDATPEIRNQALAGMASIAQKLGTVKVKIDGKEIPIYDPAKVITTPWGQYLMPHPFAGATKGLGPIGAPGSMLGEAPPTSSTQSPASRWFLPQQLMMQGAMQILGGLSPEEQNLIIRRAVSGSGAMPWFGGLPGSMPPNPGRTPMQQEALGQFGIEDKE